MLAYELLAKLKHLTLWGQDDDNDLEWVGTLQHWQEVTDEINKHEQTT